MTNSTDTRTTDLSLALALAWDAYAADFRTAQRLLKDALELCEKHEVYPYNHGRNTSKGVLETAMSIVRLLDPEKSGNMDPNAPQVTITEGAGEFYIDAPEGYNIDGITQQVVDYEGEGLTWSQGYESAREAAAEAQRNLSKCEADCECHADDRYEAEQDVMPLTEAERAWNACDCPDAHCEHLDAVEAAQAAVSAAEASVRVAEDAQFAAQQALGRCECPEGRCEHLDALEAADAALHAAWDAEYAAIGTTLVWFDEDALAYCDSCAAHFGHEGLAQREVKGRGVCDHDCEANAKTQDPEPVPQAEAPLTRSVANRAEWAVIPGTDCEVWSSSHCPTCVGGEMVDTEVSTRACGKGCGWTIWLNGNDEWVLIDAASPTPEPAREKGSEVTHPPEAVVVSEGIYELDMVPGIEREAETSLQCIDYSRPLAEVADELWSRHNDAEDYTPCRTWLQAKSAALDVIKAEQDGTLESDYESLKVALRSARDFAASLFAPPAYRKLNGPRSLVMAAHSVLEQVDAQPFVSVYRHDSDFRNVCPLRPLDDDMVMKAERIAINEGAEEAGKFVRRIVNGDLSAGRDSMEAAKLAHDLMPNWWDSDDFAFGFANNSGYFR